MTERDKKYQDIEVGTPQTLRKETLKLFLLFSMGVCSFWIITDFLFLDPFYIWFAAAPLVYMIPAYIINAKGYTSLGWHIVLISTAIFITLTPLVFAPLVSLLLILFVIYQMVVLGFHSLKIKSAYIIFLGVCILGFLILCHRSLTYAEPTSTLTANLLTAVVAIVMITIVNRIQHRELIKIKEHTFLGERQLIQSEGRYRTLFESSPAGIIILDLSNKTALDCNDKMLDLFEDSKLDILSGNSLDFSPEYQPDGELSSEKYQRLLNQYLKDRLPVYTNWQYRTKNGRIFYADVTLSPIHIGGKNLAVQQIFDITERKEAEIARLQNEIRYQTLFKNGYDGILIFDLEKRRPISCNQVTLDMLGISEEELPEFDFIKHTPEHQPNGQATTSFIWHHVEKVIREKKIQFEWLQYDTNGRAFHSEVSAFAMPKPEDKYAIIIFKNITEKVITQRALEIVSSSVYQGQEQSFFDDLVKRLAVLLHLPYVMITEVDQEKYTLVAKAIWAKDEFLYDVSFPMGDTPCEIVINSGETMFYPENVKEIFPADQYLVDWDIESYLGYPLRNSDKEIIGHMVVMDTMPINNPELAKTVLQIFSNRVASEMERERNQKKLEKSNEELKMVNSELDRFVYSAAHDIRAPVSSVLGLINISEEQEDMAIIKHYLSLQKSSLKKLDLFITDLINYSINKRRHVANELIDLPELLGEVIDQYRYLGNFNHIDIQQNIEQEEPLFSDKNRLKLILNNLISNAINYADLEKENPVIKIDITVEASTASINVWDNGQGIAPDQIQKIFEMFHRANKHSKGSGIGLYITNEAVEKLGGKIGVKSDHTHWTNFSFKIINQMQSEENLKISN